MKKLYILVFSLFFLTLNAQDRFEVKLANFNSKVADFGPSFTKQGLIFASERDSGYAFNRRHYVNGKHRPFLQLFSVKEGDSTSVKRLKSYVNKKFHESTVALTNDGNTMYFTRNNYFNNKFKKDKDGLNRLKLYKATLVNGKWGNVIELPFNSDQFSVAHPTLNKENTKLYFASDMPGTLGLSDIFHVDINEDGTYGDPVNMGGNINTEGSDTFPFISANGDLYFSSNGHEGAGGLDVFVSLKEESYSVVHNLGAPINGISDDFSLIFDNEKRSGYFSSNRVEGIGDDDIYEFKELTPLVVKCEGMISGIAKDDKGVVLSEVNIELKDASGNTIANKTTASDGAYSFSVDCNNTNYKVSGAKANYESDGKTIALSRENKEAKADLVLQTAAVAVGVDLAKELNLNPIYFNVNKAKIRPDAAIELKKVIAYMMEFPTVKVQVRSHTDSRGSDAYNLKLSDRRAKSTAQYIIKEGGIDANRITGQGFGETKLLNQCANGVRCSKADHQLNRRSEFIVVER